jgi:hypothetical protein
MTDAPVKVIHSHYGIVLGEVPASYDAKQAQKHVEEALVGGKDNKVRFMYKDCSSGTCKWQVKFVHDPATYYPVAKEASISQPDAAFDLEIKSTGNNKFSTVKHFNH